ncbi:hypothetical protein DDB_G0275341 [Dictyostelium discoideum AX4]|uniref:DSCP-N domain-containing protein n=1 Tax=Dictyostelium discoideum TaxID=44689 RepID=Q553Q4_DICDI|nr:hypothetical protein DDB_G0275341 [Dictyostelium discoideum AX4]EAL69736.1 hypothetical protein DDB_G0275341 [Dictyostelium discoideum AX4]|eukprot:XP_643666.1 hypothetical protein DDB_G0275341 [Dictyostelium discoideum AX4]
MNKCNILLLFLFIFYQFIKIIKSSYECELLNTDLCLSAYPNCLPLFLNSCCPGQMGICSTMDSAVKYGDEKSKNVTGCLRHIQSGVVYELYGPIDSMVGFEFFPTPNKTCEDLGCKNKGLECLIEPIEKCETILKSPCCVSEPKCNQNSKLLLTNVTYGNGNCDSSCPPEFNCRFIGDVQQCLPSRCGLVECPQGTECKPLDGLDIVSCFKTILPVPSNQSVTCDQIKCPDQFYCGKGIFSDADCIPLNIDLIGREFDCNLCPTDWKCDKFGWGGLCIEWKPFSPGDGEPCLGGVCLFNQYCNTTSQQCEFPKCDDATCHKGMSCIQYQVSHPRVCATTNVIPFTSLPDSLVPYTK